MFMKTPQMKNSKIGQELFLTDVFLFYNSKNKKQPPNFGKLGLLIVVKAKTALPCDKTLVSYLCPTF